MNCSPLVSSSSSTSCGIDGHSQRRRCEHGNCTAIPYFAVPGEKARFCSQHKLQGMCDVQRRRRCESDGCLKQPCFGEDGQSPRFCSLHRSPGMVDVKNRRCEHAECRRQPIFGMSGEKGRFCSQHKLPNMINIQKRQCDTPGCPIPPAYNLAGLKPRYCEKHADPALGHVMVKGVASRAPKTVQPAQDRSQPVVNNSSSSSYQGYAGQQYSSKVAYSAAAPSQQFMRAGGYPSVSQPLGPRYPPTAASHLRPGLAAINTLSAAVAYTFKRNRSESEGHTSTEEHSSPSGHSSSDDSLEMFGMPVAKRKRMSAAEFGPAVYGPELLPSQMSSAYSLVSKSPIVSDTVDTVAAASALRALSQHSSSSPPKTAAVKRPPTVVTAAPPAAVHSNLAPGKLPGLATLVPFLPSPTPSPHNNHVFGLMGLRPDTVMPATSGTWGKPMVALPGLPSTSWASAPSYR